MRHSVECCNNTHQGAPHTGKQTSACTSYLGDASHVTRFLNFRFGFQCIKWAEWASHWVIDYVIFAQVSSAMKAMKEMKFGTKIPWGWGWCPNFEYMHTVEKVHDTTLDDEQYNVRNIFRQLYSSCKNVLRMQHQPEAFGLVTTSRVTCLCTF